MTWRQRYLTQSNFLSTTSLSLSRAVHLLFCFSQEKPLRWKEMHIHTHTHPPPPPPPPLPPHTHIYTHTHTDSVNVLFSMKYLSRHEKKISARKLHRQYCHPPFSFLKKVLLLINEKDDKILNILEKYLNCCSVCKRFKPTLPKLQLVIVLTQIR